MDALAEGLGEGSDEGLGEGSDEGLCLPLEDQTGLPDYSTFSHPYYYRH